jgi:hypothetical protein
VYGQLAVFCFQLNRWRVEIDIDTFVIEMHTHVRIPLRGFNDRCVERRAPDRIDALFRIDIVRGEVQLAGFIVNHPAAHRDRRLQRFISEPDLFQRVNAARRDRQINRSSADDVAFARISAPLIQINIISTPAQIRGEQTAREAAADENKLRHANVFIRNPGTQRAGMPAG